MTTPATPTRPAYLKRSAYAALIGRSPGYITQLAAQGRVVFTPDGRFVDVAKTDALLAATADPAKQPVADRHAANRAQKQAGTTPPPTEPEKNAQATEEDVGKTFHASKAVKEKYLALAARRDYEKSIGLLIDAHDAYYHMANVMTTCRAALERIPTQLAPQLVGLNDESKAQQMLADYIEHTLENMSREISNLKNN